MEIEKEKDGCWLGEVLEMPGVLGYGQMREKAVARVQALVLQTITYKLEHSVWDIFSDIPLLYEK